MNWMDQLGGLLQQYAGATPNQQTQSAEQDFDQLINVAPRQAVSGGLAESFRSDQTPPFPNMLGQLFGNSNGMERAGMLNTLLSTAGPGLLSAVMARYGGQIPQTQAQMSPEEADRIPPEAVQEMAEEAQKSDPSVIDRVSDFYAEHSTLVKSLGAAALAVAMSGMAKQKRGLF